MKTKKVKNIRVVQAEFVSDGPPRGYTFRIQFNSMTERYVT
jgi:hypothetical protein